MQTKLANLNDYRRRRSKERVFTALEYLYTEVLERLEDEHRCIDPDELEEFILQVLGDHLVGEAMSLEEIATVDERYRRFDARLRGCLQTKIHALHHFEALQRDQRFHR